MSCTKVDLPDPETPATQTRWPKGIRISIFFRLCSLAPKRTKASPTTLTFLRFLLLMRKAPLKYLPVKVLAFLIS